MAHSLYDNSLCIFKEHLPPNMSETLPRSSFPKPLGPQSSHINSQSLHHSSFQINTLESSLTFFFLSQRTASPASKSCQHHLQHISRIWPLLPTCIATILVSCTLISHRGNCKICLIHLPTSIFVSLLSVLNPAVRVIYIKHEVWLSNSKQYNNFSNTV